MRPQREAYSSLGGVDHWALGLLVIGIGTVATAINFLLTFAALRAPGMSFKRLPLFTWMSAVNSFLIILAFPALNSALFMLLIDWNLHAPASQFGALRHQPSA